MDQGTCQTEETAFDVVPFIRKYGLVKTTVDIPDVMFRQVKALAAARGVTLRRFFTEALEEQLRRGTGGNHAGRPPWMDGFGALSDLADEHRLVLDMIDEGFEKLTSEDLA